MDGKCTGINTTYIHTIILDNMSEFSNETPARPRCCVAVLTRGYPNLEQYHTLIDRNQYIDQYLTDKSIPLLFFHEGNITEEQQRYIANQTPRLDLRFVNICEGDQAFRKEKELLAPKLVWGDVGYRHMCSFWFVDFWHFVQEYDYLIRIDEDCMVKFSLDGMFETLINEPYQLITGMYSKDDDFVTVDLNKMTRNFIHDETNDNNVPVKYPAGGPYTNLLGLDIQSTRNNARLQRYIAAVEKTNNIYYYRWGDLPLWGEAITYILGEDVLKIDANLKYYHGSHYRHVNGEP